MFSFSPENTEFHSKPWSNTYFNKTIIWSKFYLTFYDFLLLWKTFKSSWKPVGFQEIISFKDKQSSGARPLELLSAWRSAAKIPTKMWLYIQFMRCSQLQWASMHEFVLVCNTRMEFIWIWRHQFSMCISSQKLCVWAFSHKTHLNPRGAKCQFNIQNNPAVRGQAQGTHTQSNTPPTHTLLYDVWICVRRHGCVMWLKSHHGLTLSECLLVFLCLCVFVF